MKVNLMHRLLLLGTGIIASYQIIFGIDAYQGIVTFFYTVAFGVLVISSLMLLLLGIEILENMWVSLIAALLPIGFSMGMVYQYLPEFAFIYLVFTLAGYLTILVSRVKRNDYTAFLVQTIVHGVGGILMFFLPIVLLKGGQQTPQILFISLGSLIMGLTGILLVLLKSGKAFLAKDTIYMLFPGALFVTAISFAMGFYRI